MTDETTPAAETAETKREDIKNRIATAQARIEERSTTMLDTVTEKAIAAKDGVTKFAKDHPVATVAGGVAVGVLISALFRNSPTRKAGRYAGAKAAGFAAIGTEIAAAFAQQVMATAIDAKQAGADKLEDISDTVGDTARRLRRDAGYRAGGAGDSARSTAREVGKSIARSFRRH